MCNNCPCNTLSGIKGDFDSVMMLLPVINCRNPASMLSSNDDVPFQMIKACSFTVRLQLYAKKLDDAF